MCYNDSVINISHLTCGDSFYARKYTNSTPGTVFGAPQEVCTFNFTRDVKTAAQYCAPPCRNARASELAMVDSV